VKGGAQDFPYTYMQDMASGTYKLPWSDKVQVVDGTSCGFTAPQRAYKGIEPHPLVPRIPAMAPREPDELTTPA